MDSDQAPCMCSIIPSGVHDSDVVYILVIYTTTALEQKAYDNPVDAINYAISIKAEKMSVYVPDDKQWLVIDMGVFDNGIIPLTNPS